MKNPASIESILADHGPFLRRLARALVSDAHLADDLVQDTWSVALTSPERVPRAPEGSRDERGTRAWLVTVLRQLAFSHFRKAGIRNHDDLSVDHPGGGETARETSERLERDGLVHDALKAMDEPYRTVLVLKFHDGLRSPEIARVLGVPESTVRTQTARGLQKMRRALDAAYGDASDPRAAWMAALAPLLPASSVGVATSAERATKAGGQVLGAHGGWVALGAIVALGLVAAGLRFSGAMFPSAGSDATSASGLGEPAASHVAHVASAFSGAGDPDGELADGSGEPGLVESRPSEERSTLDAYAAKSASETHGPSTPIDAEASISGAIRLADGSPVVGQTVRAFPVDSDDTAAHDQREPISKASTDEGGRFQLEGLPEGAYALEVATDFGALRASPAVASTGEGESEFTVDALLVKAALPKALLGAADHRSLEIHSMVDGRATGPGRGLMNWRPDAEGCFSLLLPCGTGYELIYESAQHERHQAVVESRLPSGSYRRDLIDSYPDLGAVHVVLRGETLAEELVVGVTLTSMDTAEEQRYYLPVHAPARSRRDGLLAPGRYRVSTGLRQEMLEGWFRASSDTRTVTVAPGNEVTLEVKVERAGALVLAMEDPLGAAPETEAQDYGTLRAEVLLDPAGEWTSLSLARILRESDRGLPPEWVAGEELLPGKAHFNHSPLPAGPLRVRVRGEGWRTVERVLEIVPGERTPWTVRLERAP